MAVCLLLLSAGCAVERGLDSRQDRKRNEAFRNSERKIDGQGDFCGRHAMNHEHMVHQRIFRRGDGVVTGGVTAGGCITQCPYRGWRGGPGQLAARHRDR